MNRLLFVFILVVLCSNCAQLADASPANCVSSAKKKSPIPESDLSSPREREDKRLLLKASIVRQKMVVDRLGGVADGRPIARIPHGYTRITNGAHPSSISERWTELYTSTDDGFVFHLGNESIGGRFEPSEDSTLNELGAEAAGVGDYRTAVMHYGRALRIASEVLGKYHPGLLQILEPYSHVLKHFNWPEETKDVEEKIASMTRSGTPAASETW